MHGDNQPLLAFLMLATLAYKQGKLAMSIDGLPLPANMLRIESEDGTLRIYPSDELLRYVAAGMKPE